MQLAYFNYKFANGGSHFNDDTADECAACIASTQLTSVGLLQLSEALANNTTVTALDLSRNQITSEGAKV